MTMPGPGVCELVLMYRELHQELIPDAIHDTSQYANYRISRLEFENGVCADLNRLSKLSDSWAFMLWFIICST
ncbi:MAG: hypothetical protein ACI9FD_002669 [Gammaproteobacteria bacterium]|jgi:hypothetical protein